MTHTTHCLYFSSFYDKYSITFKTLDHSCYQALSTKVINLKVYSLKISFGNITLFQNTGPLPLRGTVRQSYWFKKAYSWIFFPVAISTQGWLFFPVTISTQGWLFFPVAISTHAWFLIQWPCPLKLLSFQFSYFEETKKNQVYSSF